MFTGLVAGVGRVVTRTEKGELVELVVEHAPTAEALGIGDSVAVSGVCLTATRVEGARFHLDVAPETQRRTKLGAVGEGDAINLELPLRADDRLGGHFVQGHVDELGRVEHAGPAGDDWALRVAHDRAYDELVVEKGSITLDGVSLTVTRCGSGYLEVMLIPHTLEQTTLSDLKPSDGIHVEYDILAKYLVGLAKPYLRQEPDPDSEAPA